MPDYTDSAQATIRQFQGAASSVNTDASPDDAARAFELSQASGVPAETISQDIPSFEAWHKAQLAQGIIAGNPHITNFVNAHPLHGQLISDDIGNLDRFSRAYERLIAKDPIENFSKGFKEGFGSEGFGHWQERMSPEWERLSKDHFAASQAWTLLGLPLEFPSRLAGGTLAGLQRAIAPILGKKAADDLAGLAEQELIKPTHKFEVAKGKTEFEYPAEGEVLPPEPKAPGGLPPKGPETIEGDPVDLSRRGFLKGAGAVAASAALPKGLIKGPLETLAGATERLADPQIPQALARQYIYSLGDKQLAFEHLTDLARQGGKLGKAYTNAAELIRSGAIDATPSIYDNMISQIRQHVESVRPYLEAGDRPPPGVSDVVDQISEESSKRSQELSDEVFDAKGKTALSERSPDKFAEFSSSLPKGMTRIQIEAFDKLGEAALKPEALGWIENLQEKLVSRPASLTVPTNDFFSKTPKELWPEIKEFVAHGEDITPNEIDELKQNKIPLERIQAAATRYQGKVYTGNVHIQSLEAAAKDQGMDVSQFIDKVNKEAGKTEATHDLEGFITSNGRFVSREEARQIADRADQITNLARRDNKPTLSMEEIKVDERPGFGQLSQKSEDIGEVPTSANDPKISIAPRAETKIQGLFNVELRGRDLDLVDRVGNKVSIDLDEEHIIDSLISYNGDINKTLAGYRESYENYPRLERLQDIITLERWKQQGLKLGRAIANDPLRRKVLERDARGRPIRTAPLDDTDRLLEGIRRAGGLEPITGGGEPPPLGPRKAIWAGKHADLPIEVLDEAPHEGSDGRMYQKVRYDGAENYIPADEIKELPGKGPVGPPSEPPKTPLDELSSPPPSRIFSRASAFGRTEREYTDYERLMAQRDAEDVAWRLARAEKEATKVNSKEWKDEVNRLTPEVRDEISSRKEIEAYRVFKDVVSPFKRRLKISQGSLTREQSAVFPARFSTPKGGYSPDAVANLFGFESGDDLVATISALEREETSGRGNIVDRLVEAEVDRRVREKLGESAKERLDEATDHALSLTAMEQLHEQMVRLGTQIGTSISIPPMATKLGALNLLHQEPFGGVSSARFQRDAAKFSRRIEKNLLPGSDSIARDPVQAFQDAQAQYISAEMAKEAKQVEKEKRVFDRLAKRYQSREVAGRDPAYTNWVHDILNRIGEGRRVQADIDTEINASPDETLKDFITSRAALGREIYTPEFLLDPTFEKPLDEMPTLQARQLMMALKSLDKVSRDENRLEVAGQKGDRKKLLDDMVSQLESLGPATVVENRPGRWNNLRAGGRTYLAYTLQMESLLNRWDRGNAFGVFNQWIGRPLIEAANYESTLQREIAKDYKNLPGQLSREDLNKSIPNTIFRDPQDAWQSEGKYDFSNADPIPLTRRHLRAILLNAGNPSNLKKLADGYQIKPEQVMDWLNTYAKKEDWDWAQAHGKIFEKLKGLSDTMRRNLSGIAPENVPLEPIVTPHGTYEGWYHPIIYDPVWRGEKVVPSRPRDLFEGDNPWSRANTPAAYTKSRTNYTAPMDLSLDQVPARFTTEIHDIAFHKPIVDASKILYDSRFLNAVTKFYGRTYSDMFEPWLRDIANARNYTSVNQSNGAKILNYFRTNMVGTLVGLNPGTVEKHTITALANSIRQVGAEDFLAAARSLYNDNGRGQSNWDFAISSSEELQRRHQNFMESISGVQENALEGPNLRQSILRIGTTPVAKLDLMSAVPTWLAEYKKALEGRGNYGPNLSPGDAVFAADQAVRFAHGSTAITSRPAISRDYPSMAVLYNFMNRMAQYQYEAGWKARDILTGQADGKKAEWSKNIISIFFVNVLLVGLIDSMVSDIDDKDTFETVASKSLFTGAAAPWPIVREAAHAMTHRSDPMLGMGTTELKSLTDLVRDLGGKDFGMDRDRLGKTVKHLNNALGLLTGLTNAEVGNLAEYIIDLNSGKAHPRNAGDWWRGIRRGRIDQPTSEERALRLITGGKR